MKTLSVPWWMAVGLALLLSLGSLVLGILENRMIDFEVNDRAARRILLGETLYRGEDGHFQFKYPPAAAFLYLPLTLIPPVKAKAVWLFLSLLAIGFSVHIALRLVIGEDDATWALRILPVVIMGKYLLRELELGQINVFILLFMLVSARLLDRADSSGRPRLETVAGCFWGLATALKPYTLIFLPYLVLRGKFRALAAGTACLAASLLLPGLYYGFSGNLSVIREWIRSLTVSTPHLLTSQDNISVFACAAKHIGNPGSAFALGLGVAGGLALGFLLLVLSGRRLVNPFADATPPERRGLKSEPRLSRRGREATLLYSAPLEGKGLSGLRVNPEQAPPCSTQGAETTAPWVPAFMPGSRRVKSLVLEVFLLLLLTPLVSPLGWDYTLLAGLPAVILLFRNFNRFPKAGRIALAVGLALMPLFLFDLFGRELYGALMRLGLPTANALALAGCLAYLRRHKAC